MEHGTCSKQLPNLRKARKKSVSLASPASPLTSQILLESPPLLLLTRGLGPAPMLFGRKDATQFNFIFALIFTFFFRKIVVYTNW